MGRRSTIPPERWQQIQDVFYRALEAEGTRRQELLADACGDDEDLRSIVDSLIRVHEKEGPLGDPSHGGGPVPLEEFADAVRDRYAIERPLGSGGMAVVFLGRDLRHDREVAIKVLQPKFSATLGAERFLREIKIAAMLRHPNILPLYDSGEAGGFLFYVMPVEGESLQQRLRRDHTIPLPEALRLTCEILDALDYAHSEGVVHRDMKPGNVLLSRGHAVIADFGIARAISAAGGDRITVAGFVIGTPSYMSPEQLVGDPHVDGRSDLYSVGCMLHEMVTGTLPPGGSEAARTGVATLLEIPDQVKLAIQRALMPQPEQRFATAGDFAAMLTVTPVSTPGEQRGADVPSIAVLPLANLSSDPEGEYFSDGITEEIINALAQLERLRVAARTSSFAFKGKTEDVTAIGAKLRVGTVLEGSIRKAGDRVRITVQLVNTADGYQLWSERYDRRLDDIFAVQDEIARTIAERLEVTLSGPDRPLVKPATENMDAYRLYLKGRHLWNRRTRKGLEEAVVYFEQAIGTDHAYASPHAGLADCYLLLGAYGFSPRADAVASAQVAAERALVLDPDLAEAHASRGQVLRYSRDWRGEEEEYRRAIALNPGYATARQWYATLLAALGRFDEAMTQVRKAEELDPLSHAIGVTVAVVLFAARKYREALAQIRRTIELEPGFASSYAWLGILYAQLGEYGKVADAVERAVALSPDNPNVTAGLAFAYARQGQQERAVDVLETAARRGVRGWPAMIWVALGEFDRAFEEMERALALGESWDSLLWLRTHEWWDPVRDDPRFEDLLRRTNLAE